MTFGTTYVTQVGSARSDWTRVINVNSLKTRPSQNETVAKRDRIVIEKAPNIPQIPFYNGVQRGRYSAVGTGWKVRLSNPSWRCEIFRAFEIGQLGAFFRNSVNSKKSAPSLIKTPATVPLGFVYLLVFMGIRLYFAVRLSRRRNTTDLCDT